MKVEKVKDVIFEKTRKHLQQKVYEAQRELDNYVKSYKDASPLKVGDKVIVTHGFVEPYIQETLFIRSVGVHDDGSYYYGFAKIKADGTMHKNRRYVEDVRSVTLITTPANR